MSGDAGTLLYLYRDCVFRVPDGVQAPKAGSRFFCNHLTVRAGERGLELGAGLGLAAVLAARAGARVVATDIVPVHHKALLPWYRTKLPSRRSGPTPRSTA